MRPLPILYKSASPRRTHQNRQLELTVSFFISIWLKNSARAQFCAIHRLPQGLSTASGWRSLCWWCKDTGRETPGINRVDGLTHVISHTRLHFPSLGLATQARRHLGLPVTLNELFGRLRTNGASDATVVVMFRRLGLIDASRSFGGSFADLNGLGDAPKLDALWQVLNLFRAEHVGYLDEEMLQPLDLGALDLWLLHQAGKKTRSL
jgi:hypothetical protein